MRFINKIIPSILTIVSTILLVGGFLWVLSSQSKLPTSETTKQKATTNPTDILDTVVPQDTRTSVTQKSGIFSQTEVQIAAALQSKPASKPASKTTAKFGEGFLSGVYDCFVPFDKGKAYSATPQVMSVYSDWADYMGLADAIDKTWQKYNPDYILITLEPYTTASGNTTGVFADTLNGKNDIILNAVNQVMRRYDSSRLVVRWAHEMELKSSYPWSSQEPASFIAAWRYVVDYLEKDGGTNTSWMWSPAGNKNSRDYYPGEAYADSIGLTVLSYQDWHQKYNYGGDGQFVTLMKYKYDNVAKLNRNIFIAELGIAPPKSIASNSGVALYQKAWLEAALESVPDFPKLIGSVYFNCKNPVNYSGLTPDWTLRDSSHLWSADAVNKAFQ